MMRLDVLLPHLKTGGIEVGLVRLAPELLARNIRMRFVLQENTGELRAELPDDVAVVGLDAGGMWASARAYAALLRSEPCDVVHTATNALNVAQMLAGRLLGSNAPAAVLGEHIPLEAFLATRKRAWLRRAIMRRTYGRATAIVSPTQNILTEHQSLLGPSCPPCTVLPNPVISSLTPPAPVAKHARRFVALGRLSPEKDFGLAMRMMAAYRTFDPKAQLTIYGEGPERGRLETLRRDLRLEDVVAMPGRTDDVAGALAGADVYVCTSQVEGFGNAIVEAQGAGLPVFSVDCPFGPRLLLQDGTAGCLVSSRNPDALAEALHGYATQRDSRETAQRAGQEVASAYTIDASADAHAAFFHRIAGQ